MSKTRELAKMIKEAAEEIERKNQEAFSKLKDQVAEIAIEAAEKIIKDKNIRRDEHIEPVFRYYTSDSVKKFEELGSIILDNKIQSIINLLTLCF